MKLIIIFGPQAVGKMTVGQELEKITGLKLFHNHMTSDIVAPFFDFETPIFKKLVALFRIQLFEEVARSDLEGVIFTYAWAFNQPSNKQFINSIVKIFKKEKGETYYVELEASVTERLKRNVSPHRLAHKPNKKNIESSKKSLIDYDKKYVLNTTNIKFTQKNYIKINNTTINAAKAAKLIKDEFKL